VYFDGKSRDGSTFLISSGTNSNIQIWFSQLPMSEQQQLSFHFVAEYASLHDYTAPMSIVSIRLSPSCCDGKEAFLVTIKVNRKTLIGDATNEINVTHTVHLHLVSSRVVPVYTFHESNGTSITAVCESKMSKGVVDRRCSTGAISGVVCSVDSGAVVFGLDLVWISRL
jgi:hypothetical protein